MKCKYNEETLRLIALAIGTSSREGAIGNHHLRYLANKLVGKDGLSLDIDNGDIFVRLRRIVKEIEDVKT